MVKEALSTCTPTDLNAAGTAAAPPPPSAACGGGGGGNSGNGGGGGGCNTPTHISWGCSTRVVRSRD